MLEIHVSVSGTDSKVWYVAEWGEDDNYQYMRSKDCTDILKQRHQKETFINRFPVFGWKVLKVSVLFEVFSERVECG